MSYSRTREPILSIFSERENSVDPSLLRFIMKQYQVFTNLLLKDGIYDAISVAIVYTATVNSFNCILRIFRL